MKHDAFGDRMKAYESVFTDPVVSIRNEALCVRIDGKGFSKYTKGFVKPFDGLLSSTMSATTKTLVELTNADVGYTQSDEITLIYTPGPKASEYMYGGKISKINSVLASMATAHFNNVMGSDHPRGKLAYFDCRSWGVPTIAEAANVLLWRAQDARKNSTSALFRWNVGHKAMHGLDQADMKQYLMDNAGVDWNNLPNKWKYGTYFKPVNLITKLTSDDIRRIPEKHRPKDLNVTRKRIIEIDVGYFGDMDTEQRTNFIIQ